MNNAITAGSVSDAGDSQVEKPNSLGFTLTPQQNQEVERLVASIDVRELTSADIVQLGLPAEQALQKTLDGFLTRLDKTTSGQVFDLFEKLEKGVNDANLPEVLRKIQDAKPSLMRRLMGFLKGKSAGQITRETYENIRELLSGKTQTLAYAVGSIEKDLARSMQKLTEELQSLEQLKESYHAHVANFGTMAVAAQRVLEASKVYLLEMEQEQGEETNPIQQAKIHDMRQKVQLLESRTLSLVGAFTRMPADHVIIQQIEQAGVATLQETAITASSRFASIKTTLLALNGAFNVKSVQQMASKQADMDRQLQQVRSQLTREIVATAISSPGDNRLEQAAQIEKILQDAREIRTIIKGAQEANAQKFQAARDRFETIRKQLSEN